jgi:excisionase family DNA binding protein
MMNENIEKLSLRPRAAAKAIGVSERTLWTWTHKNEIPHIRMGKTILYPIDALRKWLDARTNEQRGQ